MHAFQAFDAPVLSEEKQCQFFLDVKRCAQLAEAKCGVYEYDIAIGAISIRLRFIGPGLKDLLLPAIGHLRVARACLPDAVFHVWDSVSSGVEITRPPCNKQSFTDRGDIWGLMSDRIRSAFHWSEYSVNLMNMESNEGIFWVSNPDALPYWSKSSPFRTLFHWLLEKRGLQLVHGACVGTYDGGILITGKGGVGKSTSALACLCAGMRYLGDDYVVVAAEPEPRAFSLYSTAKLHHDQKLHFGGLTESITNGHSPADEKAVLQLTPVFQDQVALSIRLRAVVTPTVVSQIQTDFESIDPAELLQSATFTTMTQLPHAGENSYDIISDVLNKLPGLRMRLGSDLSGIPKAIQGLLSLGDDEIYPHSEREISKDQLCCPMVSVIIPVKNGERFVIDALRSIEKQNYPNIETIIVDDASTDDLKGTLGQLSGDIRLLQSYGEGPAAARNVGIRNATAELIAFLDVDDLWPDDRLRLMVQALQSNPEIMVAHGYSQLMRLDKASNTYDFVGSPRETFPYYIGAGLYRRDVFSRIGLFDTRLIYGEDTDWFSRAEHQGIRIEKLDLITLHVRRHDSNMTRDRTLAELTPLLMVKKLIDRKRAITGFVT